MVQRVWSCVEQPLVLRLLAVPLHPLVIVLLFVGAFASALLGRETLSKALGRVAGVASLALLGACAVFGIAGLALVKMHANPTSLLGSAPWFWSGLGPIAMWGGVSFSGLPRTEVRNMLLTRTRGLGRGRKALNWGGLLLSGLIALVIGARAAISDQHLVLSAPYRAFEFVVPDQIERVTTDECLEARVLEYGASDTFVGQKAAWELEARGETAADGVAKRLNQTRASWPPEPNTVTVSGVSWSLEFLRKQHSDAKAITWTEIPWKSELERMNGRRWTLRDANWLSDAVERRRIRDGDTVQWCECTCELCRCC